jgi:carnitine O-palmitoyltransferase 1
MTSRQLSCVNLGVHVCSFAKLKSDDADCPCVCRYDENGNTIGKPEIVPPAPIRLNWDIKSECQEAIEKSMKVVTSLIDDIDLRIYVHDNYGKGFIKRCKLSPDAYLQMALQLAYYRDAGRFSLTYEASMTRLFREGRTETVRPCTIESSRWVKAMDDSSTTTEERVELLKQACHRHQVGDGRGADSETTTCLI